MADRYWVGGTGTWNTTSTTNWSASSGGASGASVPTSADDVFFNQASTYTVTCTGTLNCRTLTVSAGTVTFAQGGAPTFAIAGGMSLVAGTVWSATGNITFTATSGSFTITTNGVTINSGNFQIGPTGGPGGTWTLGSSLTLNTSSTILGIASGTFNTGNYNITAFIFSSNNTTTRTINLGSSTVTLTGAITNYINLATTTNLTFNAGTSTIICQSTSGTFASGGLTFYNVSFTTTTATTHTITGINTFQALTVTAPAAAGVTQLVVSGQQTFNGALGTTGTAGNRRVWFRSATYGISYDFVVNATPSLTDADFRGLYVRGTAAPISGTRIGNRGECRGITFDTPKTVYWNLAGAQNWSANGWATTSTGTPSTTNFPLPQDTATFTNAGSVTGTITLDTAIGYVPNVDMSGRTSAMTLGTSNATTVYGNWTNGSGTAFTGTAALTFSGGTTQTITSAGKTFTGPITVDTYGGTVQLADALSMSSSPNSLTVTNGTFDTKNFNATVVALSSNNSNVRTITLGSSTLTLTINGGTPINFGTSTNLTFNSGTSQITVTSPSDNTFSGGGQVFYNVSFTGTTALITFSINGTNTFNNLTISGPSSAGLIRYLFSANQTINGTLASTGTTAVRRIFVRSDTLGTARTFTVGTLSATDFDFRDITIAGAAAGSSPTRAGNCGGNSGITFSSKTVYWNLAGAQNWSATGWCPTSGGTPDINQFPLAQDTAVFDNTGSVTGTITINTAWNIGTFDASARTSAMTLATNTSDFNPAGVYGDWKFGTGVTSSSTTGTITFFKNGTQTITSNGVQFGCPVTVNHPSGTVQLTDALSLGATRTLTLTAGTFDAVTYNVTTGLFVNSSGTTLRMGTGTWTLSGVGTVWNVSPTNIFVGTSTVVLSDTSTSARTLNGGGYLNKVTIGGITGISTLNINAALTIGELASTKTVAHTITFQSALTATIGKWAVTGTSGNVVTVNSSSAGTAFTLSIAGPANSGIDYLSVRDCTVSTTSPGEFYVGANSTNVSGNTRVIFTATPAARTLYWVGGTGNWSDTARWSTSSGGGSGAAIPTSLDAVVFDSASNATAYTATIDAGVTLARCASFTMAGPLSGNVTFAGSVGIAFHGNVSFAATGITRTYTGDMQWAGNSSYTFTTNGLTLASACTVNGIGATWTLGSALNTGTNNTLTVLYGTFSTSASNYSLTLGFSLSSNNSNVRSISLNGSTVTISANLSFGATNLTFAAGTSTILNSTLNPTFTGGSQTFYNVSFTSAAASTITITGANTFNTLSFAGRTTVGITPVTFSANQTITTLTLNAGTASAYRTFLASNTFGTQRTLTVTTLTAGAADYDFRDIAIAGGAAPIAPTRAGDCKGNSGITFDAAKTVYWRLTGSFDWGTSGSGGWSATSGGALDATQFPLAQDTAIFPAATYPASGSIITINANYNIGTIDMSLRTTNTMTLSTGASTTTVTIYGNWINGTGTTPTGSGRITYAGRGTQTITSAGKTFTQPTTVNSLGGSVTLLDAWVTNAGTTNNNPELLAGTFDAAGYNVTLANTGSYLGVTVSGTLTKTLAIGSGTWTLSGTGSQWNISSTTNLTVTGTGTISLTNASTKQFNGGGVSYTNITLNQGGAGTLTINGNNTFKDITNSYSATGATTIDLGGATQTVTQFTGTGAVGKVLTISGTSAASPGTLVMSGAAKATTSDYLTISNVRAYSVFDTWYAGNNSTNSGSLGWYFVAFGGTTYNVTVSDSARGSETVVSVLVTTGAISESAQASDSVSSSFLFLGAIAESAQGSDQVSSVITVNPAISESAQGSDTISALSIFGSSISDTARASDAISSLTVFNSSVSDTARAADSISSLAVFNSSLSDTAQGADTVSSLRVLPGSISEFAQASDQTASNFVVLAAISESVRAVDTVTVAPSIFNAAAVEAISGIDSFSAAATFNSLFIDSLQGSDSVSASQVFKTDINELGRVTETNSATVTFRTTLQESVQASDQTSSLRVLPGAVSETVRISESIAAQEVLFPVISESARASDTAAAIAIFVSSISEQATGQDAFTVAASTFNAAFAETVRGADTTVGFITFPTSVAESARGSDTDVGFLVRTGAIAESAQGADQFAARATFVVAFADTVRAADTMTVAPSIFNAAFVETVRVSDVPNNTAVLLSSVTESILVYDAVLGVYQWNPIPTDQPGNWQAIPTDASGSWQAIDTNQSGGWQLIPTSQGAGWQLIDDSQDPQWQNILTVPN